MFPFGFQFVGVRFFETAGGSRVGYDPRRL
jgi:hypothetical protein